MLLAYLQRHQPPITRPNHLVAALDWLAVTLEILVEKAIVAVIALLTIMVGGVARAAVEPDSAPPELVLVELVGGY